MGNVSYRFAVVVCLVACSGAVVGCGHEKIVAAPCMTDADCPTGYLCESYECVPAGNKACDVVLNGNPIVQADPHTVLFGDRDSSDPATMAISLFNLGNCTLTLYEASILGKNSAFSCAECGAGIFPLEIFPNRTRTLNITFTPGAVNTFSDTLNILSDDKEYPEMKIPLHARYIGTPLLAVAPNPVDFGYVAQGRQGKKELTLSNLGTGTAPLTLQSLAFDPPTTQDFELALLPALPKALVPVAQDKTAISGFEVVYHPRSSAKHQVNLVVTTGKGAVLVPVQGTSETPPKVSVSPASITLGQVPLGTSNAQTLTIVNQGGAPLTVKYLWGGTTPTTDLWATPINVPDVAPGQYVELKVAATASAVGALSGLLIINTNDPSQPSLTIPVSAEGVPNAGPQVVKVEMSFATGSPSIFDNDIRKVQMALEHPYGYVCNKQYPNPTTWGAYGSPSWIAFGPKENPQRVILPGALQDGTYRVMLQYEEDCASLPTQLTAGLLGISVDLLVGYLTGGAGGAINGQNVGNLISNVCLSHDSSAATVRVYVNGAIIKEKTATLGSKGDSLYALDLVRANGVFTAH